MTRWLIQSPKNTYPVCSEHALSDAVLQKYCIAVAGILHCTCYQAWVVSWSCILLWMNNEMWHTRITALPDTPNVWPHNAEGAHKYGQRNGSTGWPEVNRQSLITFTTSKCERKHHGAFLNQKDAKWLIFLQKITYKLHTNTDATDRITLLRVLCTG